MLHLEGFVRVQEAGLGVGKPGYSWVPERDGSVQRPRDTALLLASQRIPTSCCFKFQHELQHK